MNFYQEELMDHYRYPRNYGILENPDFTTSTLNPSCGDSISLQAHVDNNYITRIMFQGKGCVISQAAASMLTEQCHNKTLQTLEAIDKDYIISLVKITLGPTRLRCALLCLEALHEGIANYRATNTKT